MSTSHPSSVSPSRRLRGLKRLAELVSTASTLGGLGEGLQGEPGRTCTVCGFPLSCTTASQTLGLLRERIDNKQGGWIVTLNTEMLARGAKDPGYLELIAQADLFTADGMPLVWASWLRGASSAKVPERTTGVELVDAFLRLPAVPAFAVIGGLDPEATIARYPTTAIEACKYVFKGRVDLSGEQLDEFAAALTEHDVKAVFLALGVPKQDKLALQLRERLPHVVFAGIGGTFEILGPTGARAPTWMQQAGLEWLFRLSREPKRLWKRYLLNYPVGVAVIVKDSITTRAATR